MKPHAVLREINNLVIHCADTPPDMDIGASEIRLWHLKRGWDDIGYHAVIRRSGALEFGRNFSTTGAHVKGHNHDSLGICLVGGNQAPDYTPAQWAQLGRVIDWLRVLWPATVVIGHRDLDSRKACPQFDVAQWWAYR